MPRIKPILSTGLLLACLALLAFLGSKAGRLIARSGIVHSASSAKKPGEREASPRQAAGNTQALRADLVAASVRKLNALAAGSPGLQTDWETQAEMDGIIAKLSAEELAEVFAGISSSYGDGFQILNTKLGAAWMAMDPDAALKAALAKQPKNSSHLAGAIFSSWANHDPKGALAWLNSAEMPAGSSTLREDLRVGALYQLLERDFDLATSEYLKVSGPSALVGPGGLMGIWGEGYADDPVMRGRLVEFAKSTGRPQDFANLNRELLRRWPQEDAMGTMNYLQELRSYLESDAVPADARPEVDAKAVGAAIFREYDRPALEWWMERYGQSNETPMPLKHAMDDWAEKYPDAMLNWFQEQPPSPQRDALAASVVPSLITRKRFEDAVRSIESMQDPSHRQASAERLNLLWSEQDAAAAAAWRDSLPAGTLPNPE
ncbi:hypothetical protein [Luteolibacter sp. Populi]|uniref:hypothetical protein n=1 Tax=Luteolibacter sp. Populi TaxID=3230487 RepID=UPI003466643A